MGVASILVASTAAGMAAADATRQVQWNVGPGMVAFMYASMVVALAFFAWGCWRRLRLWRAGGAEMRWDRPRERLRRVTGQALGQSRVLRERIPGIMHALIFYAFLLLFLATVVVMIHHDLDLPIMRGRFYLYFQSLAANAAGLFLLLGLGIAVWRRHIARTPRLEPVRPADSLLVAAFALILVTGYLISGIRIVATADPWGAWRPVGWAAGAAIAAVIPDTGAQPRLHAGLWIFHVLLWHALLGVAPFTKLFHVVSAPLAIFFGNLDAKGRLPAPRFDDPAAIDVLGLRTALDMSWKQLLDLDACTECGRCQAACPAWAAGKPLSPKRVIVDLRENVRATSATILEADAAGRRGDDAARSAAAATLPALAGGVIAPETLWACTTCGACEEVCPVGIEHVRLIVRLRQNLAMEQAVMPEGVADAINGLEVRQHPFRGAASDRTSWYAESLAPATPTEGS